MLQRCNNPRNTNFSYYGGKGIAVCDRWANKATGFYNFLEDMGSRPIGYTLDRINSTKGYSPDNCRWASRTVQSLNHVTHKNSKLGFRGVQQKGSRFRARTRYQGRLLHIGMFDTPEQANEAYEATVAMLIKGQAVA